MGDPKTLFSSIVLCPGYLLASVQMKFTPARVTRGKVEPAQILAVDLRVIESIEKVLMF